VKTKVLEKLWVIIEDRKKNPIEGSYTCKMLKDKKKLEKKILEECRELLKSGKAKGKDSVEWETADLIYHMMIYLAARDAKFNDVLVELEGRMKKHSKQKGH